MNPQAGRHGPLASELASTRTISLIFCGDVMTGRGIDQALPHPGDPRLHEPFVDNARVYVELAAARSGSFVRPVTFEELWGDALPVLHAADLRITNLETAICADGAPWPDKGIHYRMHPRNIGCLTAARFDCCSLANNHALDWGRAGLAETLAALRRARIATTGAGQHLAEAATPAVLHIPRCGRVIVAAIGSPTSGILPAWAADTTRSGVNFLERLDAAAARGIALALRRIARGDDITVVSVHWGGNWGHDIPPEQGEFARTLIDEGVDVVFGHSSHHAKAVEFHRHGVILYGAGDFHNDYEGIEGHEQFRADLVLAHRVEVALRPRRIAAVDSVPFQIRQLRLHHALEDDARWLAERLDRVSRPLGTVIQLGDDRVLHARASVEARGPKSRLSQPMPSTGATSG